MGLLFRLSNVLVLPVWALMILLPRWRWTTRIMRSPLVSAAPAALYGALVLPRLGEIWPAVSRPTLSGVATLLRSPEPFPADCNPIRWFVLIPDTPIFATARSAINRQRNPDSSRHWGAKHQRKDPSCAVPGRRRLPERCIERNPHTSS